MQNARSVFYKKGVSNATICPLAIHWSEKCKLAFHFYLPFFAGRKVILRASYSHWSWGIDLIETFAFWCVAEFEDSAAQAEITLRENESNQ